MSNVNTLLFLSFIPFGCLPDNIGPLIGPFSTSTFALVVHTTAVEIPAMDVRGLPDQFWQECAGHARVRTMARHHHIYEHVFEPSGEGEAMETKRLMSASAAKNLNVSYGPDLATDNVHRGNILAAAQTSEPPRLNFSVGNGELYTVLMVSPDGLRGNGSEVLAHWVLTNVKDSADLASASCAAEYLPAIPLKGTGYHRYAFVLLQQHMSSELDLGSASSLTDRFVCVPTLMSEHRMKLRGLSFFQSTWDKSVDGNWENLVSSS